MLNFKTSRWITHFYLLLITIAGCWLAAQYASSSTTNEILSIGTGYVALVLLAVTLLIGPLNLIWKRRNGVNIDFRRDVGIWSGITGLVHVVFSLQIELADNIWAFFFQDGIKPRTDLFGISNDLGLIATIMLAVLLFTSNQLSLRWLKGKRWKLVQRFNYPLVILVLIHTFGYMVLNLRESFFFYAVIGTSVLVLIGQLIGVVVTLNRKQQRRVQSGSGAALKTALATEDAGVGRRKFVLSAGALILGGFAGGMIIGKQLNPDNKVASNNVGVADLPSTQPPPATSTPVRVQDSGRKPGTGPDFGRTTPGGAARTAPATTAPATSSTAPTTTAPAARTTAAAASSNGSVLSTKLDLKPGTAIKFTTPDTKESAFLVCHTDGSIKAFNAECTHRPYPLTYNSSQQTLYCALHNVSFETNNGAPLQRPARTALRAYNVQVDNQGNIVYVKA
jgi:sulfoxide reductase heme-binding subunit YedZ